MKIDLSKPIPCSDGWMYRHGRLTLWETGNVMRWQVSCDGVWCAGMYESPEAAVASVDKCASAVHELWKSKRPNLITLSEIEALK